MTLKFNNRLSITPTSEGGSGGGETLTVTNATGQNISAGDKVWLSHLEVPETVDDDVKRTSTSLIQVYDDNNTLYRFNTEAIEKIEYENSFNYTTVQTGITNFFGATPTYVDGVTTLRNTYQGMESNNTTCIIVSGDSGTAHTITGSLYVGDNKIVKVGNGFSIVEYNPVTGVEGATLGTSSIQANRSFDTVYMENGLLAGYRHGDWYNNNTRYVDFHDVSDLSNITYISSFQLDNESMLTSITGLQTGDIFFVSIGTGYSAVSQTRNCIIKAYRLKADKTFEACTDLPSTLQSLIGTGAYMVFNAKTNILSVGTNESIYFFEFNQQTKTFSQISFDIVMPTDEQIYANYNYIPTISEDFTMLSISWNYGEYGNQICTKYYKLSYNEGWFALPFSNVDENSLTGTAKDDIAINGSGDVAVGGYINNQNKSITVNGTYTADTGYTGLGTVTVNVPTGGAYTTMTIPFSSAMYKANGSYSRNIYWWVEDVCWSFGNFVGTINVYNPDESMRGLYPYMMVRGIDTVTEEIQPEAVMHFKITDSNDVELVPFSPIIACFLDSDHLGTQCFKSIFGDYELYWLIEKVDNVPAITVKDVTYQGTSVAGAKLVHEIRVKQ